MEKWTYYLVLVAYIATCALLPASSAYSVTIHVPSEQPTIRAGVDAAVDGDTVLLADGVYSGAGNRDVSLRDDNIVICSENGPKFTVIDCGGAGRAFNMRSYVGFSPVVEGLTIRNGNGGHQGGAVECFNASPEFENCVFINNTASHGGALYFNGNENKAGLAPAIYPSVTNCTFVANEALGVGGFAGFGSVVFVEHGCEVSLFNCVVAGNTCSQFAPIAIGEQSQGSSISMDCCDVYGNSPDDWIGDIAHLDGIDGNLAVDPVFCNAASYDLSLDSSSILVPWHEQNPCAVLIGALPATCNNATDNDGDEVIDLYDNCPGVYNPDQSDDDADNIGDVCDNCPILFNPYQEDIDIDGIGDSCDTDLDGDGYDNGVDNCPANANADQADSDGDDAGDLCDVCPGFDDAADNDGDAVPDSCDNCPDAHNPDQADYNDNGAGDACDACGDVNGDGYEVWNIADLVCLVNWMFQSQPEPVNMAAANFGGCAGINVFDLAYMTGTIINCSPCPGRCGHTEECDPHHEEGAVSLDHVDGQIAADTVRTGVPIMFHIRMANLSGAGIHGITNAFRVYSPTGAQWGTTNIDKTDALNDDRDFDLTYNTFDFSADGMGADTVGLVGVTMLNICGMPRDFDDITHTITIGPIDPSFKGGEICIDSCWYPPTNEWIWSVGGYMGHPCRPMWDGPHCFTIANCCRIRGDVNNDGHPEPDISDLVYLVTYMFQDGPEPSCMEEANIDGLNGLPIDISDLIYLVNYMFFHGGPAPAPCP